LAIVAGRTNFAERVGLIVGTPVARGVVTVLISRDVSEVVLASQRAFFFIVKSVANNILPGYTV